MNQFSAAIFDMDGLLLDSERLSLAAFRAVCQRLETGDLTALFLRLVGTNQEAGESILKEGLAGIADHGEFNSAWNQEYKKQMATGQPIDLKEGVMDLLGHLQAINTPMAVATSTRTDRAHEKLTKCGIAQFFEIIVGGDQVTESKPDPAIYLKAAQVLSVEPAQCLALEDSTNGVKAAVSAGMTVIQIPDLVPPDDQLRKLGHIILTSLTEVRDYDFSR